MEDEDETLTASKNGTQYSQTQCEKGVRDFSSIRYAMIIENIHLNIFQHTCKSRKAWTGIERKPCPERGSRIHDITWHTDDIWTTEYAVGWTIWSI